MTKAKPINFTGAELILSGGTIDNNTGEYKRHHWRIVLADGTVYLNNMYGIARWRTWDKEWPNPYHTNHTSSWSSGSVTRRKVGDFDNDAIEAWVKAQPNYVEDK